MFLALSAVKVLVQTVVGEIVRLELGEAATLEVLHIGLECLQRSGDFRGQCILEEGKVVRPCAYTLLKFRRKWMNTCTG